MKPEMDLKLDKPLTPRELQILGLLMEGHSNREIGARIFRSKDAVKYHLKNIYSKLGVHRRTQAAEIAQQGGLLSTNGTPSV